MKKLFVFAALALAGVFISGRISLGEAGAMRFLGEMEDLMNQGEADAVCDLFHADAEVSITDRQVEANSFVGGRDEICSRTRQVVAALRQLPHTMHVRFEEVTVEHSWLHPWTSTVSYVEDRTFTIKTAGVSLRTLSKDTIELVKTFSGVKVRKLNADISLVD
jgi:hypothetical protein